MKIQLNTDHHLRGDESLSHHVEGVVDHSLGRFRGQVTRVEVHLRDVNGAKAGGGDKHCTIEARLEGRPPVAATQDADTMRAAISGAARKLQRVLGSSLGRLSS
ncbi:MAG: HPF/RaiA family ribosome-associated protein [Lysobacter sp.]